MNLKLTINSLFMAVALLVSAGCTTENGDGNESSHVANQQVSLSFYQVTMQSLENSQAKTRADESSTSTALKESPFTYLDISLIPTNGTGKTIVFRQVKAEMADNFGHVSMRVPVDEYDMVAVASKNADVKINSVTEVVFPNKVTDMAAVCQKIMVKEGNNAFNCNMKRSVAKFTIENKGATTDVVKNMKFRISGNCSNKWNPTTGLAADVSVVTPTIEMNNTISRLHTYVFLSPAPPVTWIAQTVIDSMQQSPEALAEAHLQALEEQQNEMLFRLYLVSALQTEDLASYNDEDDYGQEQENVK